MNLLKKIIAITTIGIMMAGPAMGTTVEDLEAQIALLMEQLTALQAELAELSGEEAVTVEGCLITSFDRALSQGMSGDDVNCLQIVLNSDSDTQLAESGVGSPGEETSYFGPLTKAAVIKFQEKYAEDVLASWGLTEGTGYVGSTTRAKLNEILAAEEDEDEEDEEVVVPDTGLSVALAADTPEATSLPYNGTAPFTKVLLTASDEGDVTVTGMTVKRAGVGVYSDFNKVFAVSEGTRRGNMRGMTSANSVSLTFTGNHTITVPAGTSKAVTLYGNMASTAVGKPNALSITEITSSAETVTGLPVTGNLMTVLNLAAPTTAVSKLSVAGTRDIGETSVEVAKIKVRNLNAGEDITVNSITLKSIAPSSGTKVASDDVVNFEVYADDVKVASLAQINTQGYVVLTLDDPYTILKGGTKYETFYVKADIAGGPGRKLTLDIVEIATGYNIDVECYGATNGFRTYNTDTFTTTEITISNAALVVATDSINNPKSRILLDNEVVTLLSGYLTASRGPVSITGMTVALTGTDMDFGTTDEYENLRVYVDDILVSEATGASIHDTDGQSAINVAFTDEFGVDGKVTFEVTIDAKTVDDGDTIKAVVAGASVTATRDFDGSSITPSGTATGNTVTIGTGALTIGLSTTPSSVTRVAGSADVDFFGFILTASVSDNVTVTKLIFELDGLGATPAVSDVDTVRLYASDGTTLLAGPVNLNSSKNAVFTGLDLLIGKGASVKYILKGNVNSTLTAGLTSLCFEMDTAGDVLAEGSDGDELASVSGETSLNTAKTVKITVADRGTLDIGLSTLSPDTHIVRANDADDVTTEVQFWAANEDVSIKKLVLTASSTTAADDEVEKLTLKCGGVFVASSQAISSGVVTFLLPEGNRILVPAGGVKFCTLETDYNSTLEPTFADSGAIVQWTVNNIGTDLLAEGAVKDIYASVKATSGTGVTLTAAATTALTATTTATSTSFAVDAVTNIDAGDLIKIDTEYILVLSISGTTLTVRRGVGVSTAAAHNTAATVTPYDQKLAGESVLFYSNYPVIESVTQPSGILVPGEYDVLKFKMTSFADGEYPVRLEEAAFKVYANGIEASTSEGWYISKVSLWNGSKQVGSDYTTPVESNGASVTIAGLDSDNDGIIGSAGTVFTVKAQIAGAATSTFAEGDSLRFVIDSFGSASAAGTITAGDIDWEDDLAPTSQIQWMDTTLTTLQGGLFNL